MEIKKTKKQGWSLFETDDYVVVLPDNESKPHGKKISETTYNVEGLECTCGVTIRIGEMRKISGRVISAQYKKPIIVHNSFEEIAS